MRVPKSIRVERLRAAIGDAKTEEILTVIFAGELLPTKAIKVKPEQWEKAIATVMGTAENSRSAIASIPAFRRFFSESPRDRKRFVGFARTQLNGGLVADEAESAVEPEQPVQHRRRRRAKLMGGQ